MKEQLVLPHRRFFQHANLHQALQVARGSVPFSQTTRRDVDDPAVRLLKNHVNKFSAIDLFGVALHVGHSMFLQRA